MSYDARDANQQLLEDGEEKARQRLLDEQEAAKRMGVELDDIAAVAAAIEIAAANVALTVDLVALLFKERMQGRLRYNWSDECWYIWDGAYWTKDSKQLVFESVRQMVRTASTGHKDRVLKEVRHPRFARAVEIYCRSSQEFAIIESEWNADKMLLGTPTGVVNLATGTVQPPKASMLINRQTSVSCASMPYCPLWLAFLLEACGGNAEMVTFLQRWCGYCLTGEVIEHALIFLQGPGGNGKSVFINVIRKIMGSYAKTAGMETFIQAQGTKHPVDIATLAGARLVVASEVEKGRSWDEQRIKAVTGGEEISARFMHKNPFEFTPHFKLTIIGNHAPKLNNVDYATRRRFNIIPFMVRPKEIDKMLEQRLIEQEGPEILRWMVDGCLAWQKDGLTQPQAVKKASAKYFRGQDVERQWFDERIVQNDTDKEEIGLLYTDYEGWMKKHIGEQPMSKRALSDWLDEQGFERYNKNSERGFFGIRLKNYQTDWDK